MDVLCRTPTTIDLKPPKHSYCHNVLVEEVDDPATGQGHGAFTTMKGKEDLHGSITGIRPVTVDEKEPLEEPKLFKKMHLMRCRTFP
jgi:hypothetical protein